MECCSVTSVCVVLRNYSVVIVFTSHCVWWCVCVSPTLLAPGGEGDMTNDMNYGLVGVQFQC